jgi:hypothetical protein
MIAAAICLFVGFLAGMGYAQAQKPMLHQPPEYFIGKPRRQTLSDMARAAHTQQPPPRPGLRTGRGETK